MAEQKKPGFFAEMFAPVGGFGVTFATMFKKVKTEEYPEVKRPTQPRHEVVDHPLGRGAVRVHGPGHLGAGLEERRQGGGPEM